MVIEDTTFYWTHRTLHSPLLFRKIHKIHHEYNNAVCIGFVYAHPIEFILGNLIPLALPVFMLGSRMHVTTFMFWVAVRIGESVDTHSGYDFSWSPYRLIPFSGSSNLHNFHHNNVIGDYSTFFSFWDKICGTNEYDKHIERLRNKQKEI